MAVRLVPAVCPSCGAHIEIPPDRAVCFCTYCGTQIVVDDGTQTINIHNFDEAEMRRVELEAQELRRQDEALEDYERRHRTWRFVVVGWVVLVIVLFAMAGLTDSESAAFSSLALTIAGVLIFGPVALFVLRPRRPRRKR